MNDLRCDLCEEVKSELEECIACGNYICKECSVLDDNGQVLCAYCYERMLYDHQ